MKQALIFLALFAYSLPGLAQNEAFFSSHVAADESDAAFGSFILNSFGANLYLQAKNGQITLYQDDKFKDKLTPMQIEELFTKQTVIQKINPDNPEDPYDLIDTMMHMSQPMATAQSLKWNSKSIEVKTNNINGVTSYFLSINEVEQANKQKGYSLIKYLSTRYGEINQTLIATHCDDVIKAWTKPLFKPAPVCFSSSKLNEKMKPEDLKKTRTLTWQDGNVKIFNYYPTTADSLTGIVIAYRTEAQEGEFELNYYSLSPIYKMSGEMQQNTWYWISTDTAKSLYTATEWDCIQLIQSYSLHVKLNPYFAYQAD